MTAFDALRRSSPLNLAGAVPTDPLAASGPSSPISQTLGSVFERIGNLVVPGANKETARTVGAVVVGVNALSNILDKATKEAQEREARDKLQKEQRDKEDKQKELDRAQRVAAEERQKREQAEALVRRSESERRHMEEDLQRRPSRMPRLVLPPPIGTSVAG